jgi:predicted NBD/HSP70 family sugar kinase
VRTGQQIPGTPALLRELNERAVLEAIRAGHPISRGEVARRSGLSKPTVSLALASLADAGLVTEVGMTSGRPGRGAALFAPVPDAGLVLGLDIGGRFVRAAIADLAGTVLAREDRRLRRATTRAALDAAAELHGRLQESVTRPIVAAACGAPAVIDPITGRAWLAGAIADLEGVAIGDDLGSRLGLEVIVENDVNLAALGEQARGLGAGVANFAFISIGTGMGAGLILGGELHRGRLGAAGEIDLVPLRRAAASDDPLGIDPSAPGIAALAERLATDGAAAIEAPDVFDAARAGAAEAHAVVAEVARWIAWYMAAIVAVADPELIVLGGGIGGSGDLLLDPVRAELAELVPRPPRIETSTLGDGVVLAGALAMGRRLALDRVFADRTVRERS